MRTDPRFEDLLARVERLSGELRELHDGVRQAITIAELDPEMALTRARKVLEFVVRDVFQRRVGEEAGTRPLENLLQRLAKDGHLPKRLAAYANAVRELGNVGTHAFGETVTKADVAQSLAQLTAILEWYFEHERAPAEQTGDTAAQAPPSREPAAAHASVHPSRRRRWAVLAAAGLACVAGAVFLILHRPGPSHEPRPSGDRSEGRAGTQALRQGEVPLPTQLPGPAEGNCTFRDFPIKIYGSFISSN